MDPPRARSLSPVFSLSHLLSLRRRTDCTEGSWQMPQVRARDTERTGPGGAAGGFRAPFLRKGSERARVLSARRALPLPARARAPERSPSPFSSSSSPPSPSLSKGGIDHLENPLAAAARELQEETAITSARVVAISSAWTAYDHPTIVSLAEAAQLTPTPTPTPMPAPAPVPAAAWARPGPSSSAPAPSSSSSAAASNNILPTHVQYRGQTQKWVLMRFYGEEAEIRLGDPDHPETAFSAYAWLPLGDLVAGTVPFKRAVYEGVAAEFGPIIDAWRGEPDAPWWGGVRR